MEIVPCRDRRTLTDLRNRKLSRNSVIYSDEWRVYCNISQFVPACIQHNTVNHTSTDAHTQDSNKFLLYVALLLFQSWLITVLVVD